MACRRLGRAVDLERLRRVFGLAPATRRATPRPARRPRPRIPPGPRPRARSPGWPPSPPRSGPGSNALPERSRARYLEWHQAGVNPDPILAGEVARLLRPKIQPAPGPSPDEPFALTGEPARPGARRSGEHPGGGDPGTLDRETDLTHRGASSLVPSFLGPHPAISWHETATCSWRPFSAPVDPMKIEQLVDSGQVIPIDSHALSIRGG